MFIVIEGIDGSGKATQAKLIADYLKKKGHKVTTFDFPRYEDNAFGNLVGRALKGEFGYLSEFSPYFLCLPFMVDQFMVAREMAKLNKTNYVICDRYVTSSFAFMSAKILNYKKRSEFRKWLAQAAYHDLGMVKPDMVIFLKIEVEMAQKLLHLKARRPYLGNLRKDLHEKDMEYQHEVAKSYLQMVKLDSTWEMINCVDNKRNLKSIEEIHREVVKLVEKV
jgi:dTMP kinase